MAKNYIDNLSEETKKGMLQKIQQGEWAHNAPYGYKRLDKNTVVPNPETAPFVKRAFEIYSDGGISLEKTRLKLAEEGFYYRTYQQNICKGSLEQILKNVFYTGKMYYGGAVYDGNHEPIISKQLFAKVQEAFKKDNKPLYRGRTFMFGNLIKCAECGCNIVAEIKKGKYTYYHCTWGKGNCSQKRNIKEEELAVQFEEAVKNINIADEHKDWIVTALKASLTEEQYFHKEKIDSLREQADKTKIRLAKIYEDKLDGIITEEFWKEQHNRLKEQHEKILITIEAHEKSNIKDYRITKIW